MKDYFYITTPIYYVNDKPHIGTVYTTIVCDVIARFQRLDGKQVKFLTGTDEHGQKVEKAAQKKGMDSQAFVDEVSQNFRLLTEKFNISNDIFIRTTEPRHYKAAQSLWGAVEEKGYIYEGTYEGWYAVRDECFYDESELVEGKAPTGAEVEWVKESSYFFKLSAFQEQLLAYYNTHPDFVAPPSRLNEVISFVKGGLRDLSISRTSFKWGVPVPNNPKHVMYVWFDALTNYITALGYPEPTSDMKNYWPTAIHMIGKDILRFHAVYWPAFLMAANLPLPQTIFAHGWWTNEGQKMSKSLGNVVDPFTLADHYGIDAIRYFMVREVPLGQDGDYSEQTLISRYHGELANTFGNLVQRVLSFVMKTCEGKVMQPSSFSDEDNHLLEASLKSLEECRSHMNAYSLHKYCEKVLQLAHLANQYVDHHKPWALKTSDPDRMKTTLWVLIQVIRRLAFLYQPILVNSASKVLDMLGVDLSQRDFSFYSEIIDVNLQVIPEPLFPKLVD